MEYGLIGEKLGHSFSKIVHSKIANYNYELKEFPENELDDFMNKADFKAINVTIPYKERVIPHLDEISDVAKKIGAVNTIINKNGKLCGYNTDFLGMKALINQVGINLEDRKVLILGSGGTSKTALAVAESLGASQIYRVSRTQGRGLITYDQAVTIHTDAEIIINTTPCGMYPNITTAAMDIDKFNNLVGVVDAVYNPLDSLLVLKAKDKGISACGGLYMLVSQAIFAAEKFLDSEISKTRIDEIYNELYLSKKNLVLIGMPSCGKSTIGAAVAKKLDKVFIDTDKEIEKREGMPPSRIIEEFGEKRFREIESEIVAEISLKQNCVVATGGGAVLNRDNVALLKANGTLLFIDRKIDQLITTNDRPLSSNRELLKIMYDQRYPIYVASADCILNAVPELEQNIEKTIEVFLNENSCN